MKQVVSIKKSVNLARRIRSPVKKDFINALIVFILERANICGLYPFGCIYFAALCDIKKAYLYIPSIFLSCLLSGANAIKYTLVSFIIWIYKGFTKENNPVLASFVCAVGVFFCGLVSLIIDKSLRFINVILITLEAALSICAYPLFSNINTFIKEQGKNKQISKEGAVSVMAIVFLLLHGLDTVTLPLSISLKASVGIYLVLCIAMLSSFSTLIAFSAFFGLICANSTEAVLTSAGVFIVGAIFSYILKTFGRLGISVGFLTGVTISTLLTKNTESIGVTLFSIFFAIAIYMIMPKKIQRKTGMLFLNVFKTEEKRRDKKIRDYVVNELFCFSNTLSEFSRQFKHIFQKGTENNQMPSKIFDETAERICRKCKNNNDCWQRNFNDTYRYMFMMYESLEASGHCDIHNAPIQFVQKCINPDLFINEFNHVYEMNKEEILNGGIKRLDRDAVSEQYREIAGIISELSDEIEAGFYFDEEKEEKLYELLFDEGIYVKDVNVIKNKDGYFDVLVSGVQENEYKTIEKIVSGMLDMRMKRSVLKDTNHLRLSADNNFDVSVTIYQKKKDEELVCGDTVVHFKTDKNKYYIIICDGMGSGREASKESRMTARLLSGFLRSGFSKNTALSLINSTLLLKMDREGFSTIDLCEIDLRSGEVEFIKIGGAQSYIKSEKGTEIISQKGLPAGIVEDVEIESISRKLTTKDMIVMVSDGISEAGYGMMRGEWIKKLMKVMGIDDNELAKSIVDGARKKIYPKNPDDMTCAVIRLKSIDDKLLEQNKVV